MTLIFEDVIGYLGLLLLLVVVGGVAWLMLPSGANGQFTVSAYNASVPVVLMPAANLSQLEAEYATAGGLYSPPESRYAVDGQPTIHLATDRQRYEIVETYAHELEHLRMRDKGMDVEQQHAVIREKNTVQVWGIGFRGMFWRWPVATWTVLPQLL